MKINFQTVSLEANRIFMMMISHPESCEQYWDQYHTFLNLCGWSDTEFDRETLKIVDRSWEPELN